MVAVDCDRVFLLMLMVCWNKSLSLTSFYSCWSSTVLIHLITVIACIISLDPLK